MACTYTITHEGKDVTFQDKKSLIKFIRDNKLYPEGKAGQPANDTDTLAKVLRQIAFGENHFTPQALREYQSNLLDMFTSLEDEMDSFFKLGMPIALTKGLGKSFDTVDAVKRNLKDLGVGMTPAEYVKAKVPFDVRYTLTGDPQYKPENSNPYYHKITANNIQIMREIDALSKTMFMERTPSFLNTSNKVMANLKDGLFLFPDKVKEVRDELAAYAQIAAYKKWIDINDKRTSTLRNSLIYDSGSGNTPTIVDIVREAQQKAPENTFLKFILPIPTTVKVAKKKQKNIKNRDLINTIEGKTRGKIEPDLLSTLMDSFSELFQNPATRYHAKALYDYLIVKDGLMFKNKSFIKMLPTVMFKEMSEATDMSTKLMAANSADEYKRILRDFSTQEIINAKGESVPYFTAQEKQTFNDLFRGNNTRGVRDKLYEKVFGVNYDNLYHNFERIYATDVKHQYNLDLIRPKIRTETGSTKQADSISIVQDADTKEIYMHVNLFPESFSSLEKGSKERKEKFKNILSELEKAGFDISSEKGEEADDNKVYIELKKFVRVQKEPGKYDLYQLITTQRDYKNIQGSAMTEEDKMVPRGKYGVYKLIEPVGTSNSTGVADVGVRPTRDQVVEVLNKKIKGDDKGKGPAPSAQAIPKTPTPTPSPTTQVQKKEPEGEVPEILKTNPFDIGGDPKTGGTIPGGIFGGMQQLPYNVDDMPIDFFSDDDVNDEPDQC
jgi:hypothetical protein